jgi:Zn-dependent protease
MHEVSEEEIIKILALILSLVIAIVGHEIMHGLVAYKQGDDTAKKMGRLSINPIIHIDPIGTIAVPALLYISGAPFLFGWAKPVPIDMRTVIHNGGLNGAMAVDLAGVAFNFSLAILSAIVLGTYFTSPPTSYIELFVIYFLFQSVIYNVILGVFNLWPIPPLDGSNALAHFGLKLGNRFFYELFQKISMYGMIILIVILATPIGSYMFQPASWIINFLIGQ